MDITNQTRLPTVISGCDLLMKVPVNMKTLNVDLPAMFAMLSVHDDSPYSADHTHVSMAQLMNKYRGKTALKGRGTLYPIDEKHKWKQVFRPNDTEPVHWTLPRAGLNESLLLNAHDTSISLLPVQLPWKVSVIRDFETIHLTPTIDALTLNEDANSLQLTLRYPLNDSQTIRIDYEESATHQ